MPIVSARSGVIRCDAPRVRGEDVSPTAGRRAARSLYPPSNGEYLDRAGDLDRDAEHDDDELDGVERAVGDRHGSEPEPELLAALGRRRGLTFAARDAVGLDVAVVAEQHEIAGRVVARVAVDVV